MTQALQPTPTWWFRFEAFTSFVLRRTMEERLKRAIRTARLDHLDHLLDASAWPLETHLVPNAPDPNRYVPRAHTGHTLLHYAAGQGHYAVVERLLARGANLNACTDWGVFVVQTAAANGHAPIVALLASRGADIERGFPSFSTFYEDDYVGPTCAQLIQRATGVEYQGNEHVVQRVAQLEDLLPQASAASALIARPRF